MPKSSGDPSATTPGGAPSGTAGGTGLCCACPANGTVNTNGSGTYFNSGYPMASTITNKCTIDIARTASGGTVTVHKTFSLSYAKGASASSHATTITNAITTAMNNWQSGANGKKLQIEQPGCRRQRLNIRFTSAIVASGADVRVTVDNTAATAAGLRSFVQDGTQMTFYLNGNAGTGWVMTHEIGHTFGLPDEYTSIPGIPITPPPTTPGAAMVTAPSATPTMTYIGAPPQPNASVVLTAHFIDPENPSNFFFDSPSIMGQSGNTTYPNRVFYWIAIEVKSIMAAAGTPANVTIV
ncbi:MAG: hypothetical protein AAFU59_08955 [Pseudomonadota bacterium]